MSQPYDHPDMPKQWVKGFVPTLNGTGSMFLVLDDYAGEFIEYSGRSGQPAAEIGCAYGIATIAALEQGATVTACDMEPRHLKILQERTPEKLREKLTTKLGKLPDLDLPENTFGSLLCSRVLHFLYGNDVEKSVAKMFRWLQPGGRLFLVADTPYGIFRNFIPVFEERLANDVRWPGELEDPDHYLPFEVPDKSRGPQFLNLLCPEQLTRTAEEAGFVVERAGFIARPDFSGLGHLDGRENSGLVAVKPA